VEVSLKNKRRVMRIVADDRMDRGKISLRQKDIDKLDAGEGSEVILNPIKSMGVRITKSIPFLGKKGD